MLVMLVFTVCDGKHSQPKMNPCFCRSLQCVDGSTVVLNTADNRPLDILSYLHFIPPQLAVRTLNLAIERGECFGLLGPNGAGKSTSINMMVGLLEPSAGTAIIGGYDIRKDMDAIYTLMGVCPQHDLLWETLTGREHLLFYGRLKGLTGGRLSDVMVDRHFLALAGWCGVELILFTQLLWQPILLKALV